MTPNLRLRDDVAVGQHPALWGGLCRLRCVALFWMLIAPAYATEAAPVLDPMPTTTTDLWHYGAYLDVAYVVNFNCPESHLWRNRGTAVRHNEFAPNMALVYVRKDANASSCWVMEPDVQGGYDSDRFAFLQGEKEVGAPIRFDTSIGRMCPILLRSATVSALPPGCLIASSGMSRCTPKTTRTTPVHGSPTTPPT